MRRGYLCVVGTCCPELSLGAGGATATWMPRVDLARSLLCANHLKRDVLGLRMVAGVSLAISAHADVRGGPLGVVVWRRIQILG